jgi:hypothetical protein
MGDDLCTQHPWSRSHTEPERASHTGTGWTAGTPCYLATAVPLLSDPCHGVRHEQVACLLAEHRPDQDAARSQILDAPRWGVAGIRQVSKPVSGTMHMALHSVRCWLNAQRGSPPMTSADLIDWSLTPDVHAIQGSGREHMLTCSPWT